MKDMDRRSFVRMQAVAAGMAAAAPVASALAAEAEPESAPQVELRGGWTSPELHAIGGSGMPDEELNRIRHEVVDATGDFVKSDGTVVPAVYNKVWNLINTYGFGVPDVQNDDRLNLVQQQFTEEWAQAYLEMPYGVEFSASNFAEESGRSVEECQTLLEEMAAYGLIGKVVHSGLALYCQLPYVYGIYEYSANHYLEDGWVDSFFKSFFANDPSVGVPGKEFTDTFISGGTPIEHAVPVSQDIVLDERIVPGDDWRDIVARYDTFAVCPCVCRDLHRDLMGLPRPETAEELAEMVDELSGHYFERCIMLGDEAVYWVEHNMGRYITKEECVAILERNIDEGCVIQAGFSKNSTYICSCHGNSCLYLGGLLACGKEAVEAGAIYNNLSHFELVYDRDACIQCGACVARCPMFAIQMDEEGYPEVAGLCMRCGQCGTVCPASARKLQAIPADQYLPLPETMIEGANLCAKNRYELGFFG